MQSSIVIEASRDIFVERNGSKKAAKLTIERIEPLEGKAKWVCVWSIDYLCPRGVAFGKDPLEALTNAVLTIHLFIKGSISDGYKIWWESETDCAGFSLKSE